MTDKEAAPIFERGDVVYGDDPFKGEEDARPWLILTNHEGRPFHGEQYIVLTLTSKSWMDGLIDMMGVGFAVEPRTRVGSFRGVSNRSTTRTSISGKAVWRASSLTKQSLRLLTSSSNGRFASACGYILVVVRISGGWGGLLFGWRCWLLQDAPDDFVYVWRASVTVAAALGKRRFLWHKLTLHSRVTYSQGKPLSYFP